MHSTLKSLIKVAVKLYKQEPKLLFTIPVHCLTGNSSTAVLEDSLSNLNWARAKSLSVGMKASRGYKLVQRPLLRVRLRWPMAAEAQVALYHLMLF